MTPFKVAEKLNLRWFKCTCAFHPSQVSIDSLFTPKKISTTCYNSTQLKHNQHLSEEQKQSQMNISNLGQKLWKNRFKFKK